MADKKLSELTELAAQPAADDEVYLRDVSELASAESKRITIANLLAGAGGAALTVAETEIFNDDSPNPAAWTDLDLSAPVGSNVALVLLKVSQAGGGAFSVRKNGDTDDFYHVSFDERAAGVALGRPVGTFINAFLVATDATGKIEWKCESVGTATIITIIAYIK